MPHRPIWLRPEPPHDRPANAHPSTGIDYTGLHEWPGGDNLDRTVVSVQQLGINVHRKGKLVFEYEGQFGFGDIFEVKARVAKIHRHRIAQRQTV